MFAVSQGARMAGHRVRNSPRHVKFLPTPKPIQPVDRGMSQGAELAGSVVVFLLIGLGLDAWLGTVPVFMLALTVFACIGQFVKIYFVYSRDMDRLQSERAARGRDR